MPATLSRILTFLAIAAACAGPAHAQESAGNALGLLDAYLVQEARSNPAYRADVKVGDVPNLPPGRFPGYSSFLGPFNYRPKTYGELTRSDRVSLLRDPAFHAFLAVSRKSGEKDPSVGQTSATPARIRHFSITPVEMLETQTLLVVIPPP